MVNYRDIEMKPNGNGTYDFVVRGEEFTDIDGADVGRWIIDNILDSRGKFPTNNGLIELSYKGKRVKISAHITEDEKLSVTVEGPRYRSQEFYNAAHL